MNADTPPAPRKQAAGRRGSAPPTPPGAGAPPASGNPGGRSRAAPRAAPGTSRKTSIEATPTASSICAMSIGLFRNETHGSRRRRWCRWLRIPLFSVLQAMCSTHPSGNSYRRVRGSTPGWASWSVRGKRGMLRNARRATRNAPRRTRGATLLLRDVGLRTQAAVIELCRGRWVAELDLHHPAVAVSGPRSRARYSRAGRH